MRKVLFIFSVLGDGDVEWLAGAGERVHVDPGTVLVPLGSHVDYVYFVLEGRLSIKTRTGTSSPTSNRARSSGRCRWWILRRRCWSIGWSSWSS